MLDLRAPAMIVAGEHYTLQYVQICVTYNTNLERGRSVFRLLKWLIYQ